MEHTITVKRSSESWMTGDNQWVEKCPLYDDDKLIEDMETWAVATALEAIRRDLSRQLLELFRQSESLPDYRIVDGCFKVSHETSNLNNRMVVELSFTMTTA